MKVNTLFLLALLIIILPAVTSRFSRVDVGWYEKHRLKASCLKRDEPSGRSAVRRCWYREGLKSWFIRNSIWWFPERTKFWNLTDLSSHCNNYYTCMENTKCYKDFILFETLDRCSHDAFKIGPMSFCDKALKKILKESPDQLSQCVKDYLETETPKKWTCEMIQESQECLLPVVEKFCDSYLQPLFKEHHDSRLYYLGCDGKLKFKDTPESTLHLNISEYIGDSIEIE